MADRLFVGILGQRNSGKSTTWYNLLEPGVKTGKRARALSLYGGESVDVFLVNGSFEERGLDAGEVLSGQSCSIILCSIQYIDDVRKTLGYVADEGFDVFVQWLNPGYSDQGETFDYLGLLPLLVAQGATMSMRDGRVDARGRAEEVRQFIYGWAKARKLTYPTVV